MDINPYEHIEPGACPPESPWFGDATRSPHPDGGWVVAWDWHDGVPNGTVHVPPGHGLEDRMLQLPTSEAS